MNNFDARYLRVFAIDSLILFLQTSIHLIHADGRPYIKKNTARGVFYQLQVDEESLVIKHMWS